MPAAVAPGIVGPVLPTPPVFQKEVENPDFCLNFSNFEMWAINSNILLRTF